MRWLRTKWGITISAGFVLLALFVVRPGANQLRTRIVRSISLAVGRPVDVAYVRIRLLPRPGFDLENFVVHDPAFGAEPMLHADEVSASLRLRSLIRGRLEIARLSLTEPSLNLVRNDEGHWNLESLLERSAQIQVAPTSKPKAEKRPAFPYIEASRARINVKFGAEKKPYTLTDADFSLWQESENAWGTRLTAQPVRTDMNLSDTGTIRVTGQWQRATVLRETPLQFSVIWERAQLGQLSKLAYGSDQGWRGALTMAATLTGTPEDLSLRADASASDFHRYNITGNGTMRLSAQCTGHYSSGDKTLGNIACSAPGPDGAISVAGTINHPFEPQSYDIAITIQGMPVQSLVSLARVARGLPGDLSASGQLDAKFRFQRDSAGNDKTPDWTGSGELSDLQLASGSTKNNLDLHSIAFALASSSISSEQAHGPKAPPGPRIEVGPFRLGLGRPTPVSVHGWVARSGYSFEMQGEGQAQRVLQVARMAGLTSFSPKAEGAAKFDLRFAGDWSEPTPRATGKAQLHSVRAYLRNWDSPLEIASAEFNLLPDEIDVKSVNASVGGTEWRGALQIPRPCGFTAVCPIRFDLHADEIAPERLSALLHPKATTQPWYRFLSSGTSAKPYLLTVNAAGAISANRFSLHHLMATQFSAKADLKDGILQLSEVRATVLGGQQVGRWQADFVSKPPKYAGSGTVRRFSLRDMAEAMHDGWVTGSADATYKVEASGLSKEDLYSSATGAFQIEAREATLPHITFAEGGSPLQVRRLAAGLLLQNRRFEIQDGRLDTPETAYDLTGTALFNGTLDLNLSRQGASGFAITGTLAEPRISEVTSETRAALKP